MGVGCCPDVVSRPLAACHSLFPCPLVLQRANAFVQGSLWSTGRTGPAQGARPGRMESSFPWEWPSVSDWQDLEGKRPSTFARGATVLRGVLHRVPVGLSSSVPQ